MTQIGLRDWIANTMRSLAIIAGLLTLSAAAIITRAGTGPQDGPPAGYPLTLALDEEFSSPVLNRSVWSRTFAGPRQPNSLITQRTLYGNAEREVYVDPDYRGLRLEPLSIHDGMLTITAAPLDSGARQVILAELDHLPQRQNLALRRITYSSGMISSRDRFAQKYGYWESRMRWSGGKGIWPAFWLLPQDGRWPPEIDIMEALGDQPSRVFSSTHSNIAQHNTTLPVTLAGSSNKFHTYGALWLPDRIEYYIDGKKTVSIPVSADMTQPMYMVLNLAVGGNWPGYPDDTTTLPAHLDIAYIKVWRLSQ